MNIVTINRTPDHTSCYFLISVMSTKNYVIAGGRGKDPANLSVNMEPVRLSEGMAIAVKSISYGEVWNVNELNNSFRVRIKPSYLSNILNITKRNEVPSEEEDLLESELKIPNGRYNLGEHVIGAIAKSVNKYMDSVGIKSYCQTKHSYGKVYVRLPDEIDYISGWGESPLTLIDATIISNELSCLVGEIPSKAEMCFVYLNICQNSWINGKRSRLLCVFPVVSNKGYTFFEFRSPTYVPIEVTEFSKINVTFRNIRGTKMEFDRSYDTVINLHVSKIQ